MMLGRFTLPTFDYYAPRNIAEALGLLRKHRRDAEVLAGGTAVLPDIRKGISEPKVIVDITRLPNLNYVKFDRKTGLRIGALTGLDLLEKSELIRKNYPAIAEAVRAVGTVQIRSMATAGGNLCGGSPFSDLAVPLLTLESELVVRSQAKGRTVPIEKLITKRYQTSLRDGEILTEIRVPYVENCAMAFQRFGRTAVDCGLAKVALAVKMDKNRKCSMFALAIGAATRIPKRIAGAEKLFVGKTLDATCSDKIAELLDNEDFVADWRAGSEHRKELSKVLAKRALAKALEAG